MSRLLNKGPGGGLRKAGERDPAIVVASDGTVPSEKVRIRPVDIAPSPLNSRTDFGTEDELIRLGESLKEGQVQPVVVVRREAFLNLWPEHEKRIGDAQFVLVAGQRRYEAATRVTPALDFLDALVCDSFGESKDKYIDAMVSENLDRKNLDPIEEAHAVEQMVQLCDRKANVAAVRYRKTPAWISQRRGLLTLPEKFQRMVRDKTMQINVARTLASLGRKDEGALEELTNLTDDLTLRLGSGELPIGLAREVARLEPEKQNEAVERALNRLATPEPSPAVSIGVDLFDHSTEINPVNGTATPGRAESNQATLTADPTDHEPPRDSGGEQRETEPTAASKPENPKRASVWSSPDLLADQIRQRLTPDEVTRLVNLLVSEQ